MSGQRYDIEFAMAPVVAQYLAGKFAVTLPKYLEISPVVTFFDPMAIDEANRFVVEVPGAITMPESPGNFTGQCVCTVKSRWAQPTVQQDLKDHFNRSNWMRDALMSATLADDLTTLASAGGGFKVDYIQPKREMTTQMREGWAYSELKFSFNGVWTNP